MGGVSEGEPVRGDPESGPHVPKQTSSFALGAHFPEVPLPSTPDSDNTFYRVVLFLSLAKGIPCTPLSGPHDVQL